MVWSLSPFAAFLFRVERQSSGPHLRAFDSARHTRDLAALERHSARAEARASREATLLQALKFKGGGL
jgi:hypothetical protein